ncbi:MAG: putative lipid II flippase FtsW [Candidatus Omnitrophota bacterium]|nr:putative lipid II flippase FtsW [Candidatus Omnitrophota bacterium]
MKLENLNRDSQYLLIITTILLCIGMVMIYSSSSCYAYEQYNDSSYYLKRHLVHFAFGLLLAGFFLKRDYKGLKKYAKVLLAISLIGLVLALLPGIGREAGGAKRWVKLGFIGFQPSEFAGFFMIVYVADILDRKQPVIRNFMQGFMPPLMILGFSVLLILLQPDLGSSVCILSVGLVMMFVAGVNMAYFLPFLILVAPVLYFLIFKVAYRLRRIVSYLDPWSDTQGAGFQIIQSFLALGSGGVLGLGLGCSKQKLFYLPQAHTDFIFSIIGEEMGLIGTLSVVALFVAFVWIGIQISIKAKDLFGRFLALGITASIGLKAVINIAVSTGAIPTKGLPLPFISYGGTALIFSIVAAAILINISNS